MLCSTESGKPPVVRASQSSPLNLDMKELAIYQLQYVNMMATKQEISSMNYESEVHLSKINPVSVDSI